MRSSRAAASAGICSAWQMWQALSGPWVWAWGSVAPTAKYSNAAQASTASARRTMVRPKIAFCQYILSKLYLSTFDGRTCLFVASLTVKVNDSSGPLLDFNVRRVHLTLQPFRPKLRLSKHMQAKTKRIRILALLLGVIFLGAQFHFCTDLTAAPSASHIARYARRQPLWSPRSRLSSPLCRSQTGSKSLPCSFRLPQQFRALLPPVRLLPSSLIVVSVGSESEITFSS